MSALSNLVGSETRLTRTACSRVVVARNAAGPHMRMDHGMIPDEELCKRSQQGNKEAELAMLKRHAGVIKNAVYEWSGRIPGFEDPDIEAVALGSVLLGVRHFKPGTGTFNGYARTCVAHALTDELRKARRRISPVTLFALGEQGGGTSYDSGDRTSDKGSVVNLEDTLIDTKGEHPFQMVLLRADLETLAGKLTEPEKRVLHLCLQGMQPADIMAKLNVGRTTVWRLQKSIRIKASEFSLCLN